MTHLKLTGEDTLCGIRGKVDAYMAVAPTHRVMANMGVCRRCLDVFKILKFAAITRERYKERTGENS